MTMTKAEGSLYSISSWRRVNFSIIDFSLFQNSLWCDISPRQPQIYSLLNCLCFKMYSFITVPSMKHFPSEYLLWDRHQWEAESLVAMVGVMNVTSPHFSSEVFSVCGFKVLLEKWQRNAEKVWRSVTSVVWVLVFRDQVSLCRPSCPGTHS